jgi:ParB family chromosome partitioning protein
MTVEIGKIKITKRIRKDITKIAELSADIQANGLINPITVMSLDGGEFQLLAGLRRLRATELLGHSEISINVISPSDAEAMLRIEISENEQREAFTFTERMDYAELLEVIEQAKAKERMSLGGKGGINSEGVDDSPPLEKKKSRDAIGEKIGMSGRQYSRAKHIAENASDEVIEEIDSGKRSISKTYKELRDGEKAAEDKPAAKNNKPKPATDPAALFTKAEQEAIKRNTAFHAMSDAEKVTELQRQLKETKTRAATAESELARLKELRHNDIYHKDGIIENLSARLEIAEARVAELEASRCNDAA